MESLWRAMSLDGSRGWSQSVGVERVAGVERVGRPDVALQDGDATPAAVLGEP